MSTLVLGNPNPVAIDSDKKKKKRKRKNKNKLGVSLEGTLNPENEEAIEKKSQNKKIKFDDLKNSQEPGISANVTPDLESLGVNTQDTVTKSDSSPADRVGSEPVTEDIKVEPVRERDTRLKETNAPVAKQARVRKDVNFDDDAQYENDDDEYTLLFTKKSKPQLEQRAEELLKVRESLPVYKVKDKLVKQLMSNRVTILIGETGSGKSTQIPQFLLANKDGKKQSLAVTQPRRVAAINLATRVAEEYGCNVGHEVGYSVRFQNFASNSTKLKYLTDGMLLRELMLDNKLSNYTTIVIDEAHERTILTDLLLGFLKQLLALRTDDFKIIVMSATLDAEKFSRFFDNAPICYVEGKMYPVERLYLSKSTDDIVDSMVKTVIQLNQAEPTGDMLCFLPGQEEIDKAVASLSKLAPDLPKTAPLIVPLPLYAALPTSQQTKIFQPVKQRQRKVILSTNIAETSVTVPGIKYVIDSGLRKVKAWKHELGLSTLLTAPISQASATQRSGRAGRESAGKCFRLYTETDYLRLPPQTDPEIVRSDIISPVLMLKKMNVENLFDWPWLEHPGEKSLSSALLQLLSLGALDPQNGKITELGEKMAVLPLLPHLSAVLIKADELNVLNPVIDIVSCLSVDNLLLTPGNENRDEVNEKRRNYALLGTKHGDLIALKEYFDHFSSLSDSKEQKKWCHDLAISYKAFQNVKRVQRQLLDYMKNISINKHTFTEEDDFKTPLDIPSVLKSFLKGFINNTLIGMPDRSYRTVMGGNLISIHPSSLLFGSKKDAIMYIEYVFTTKGYGRSCTLVDLSWLQEIAPHLLGQRVSAK